MGERAVSGVTPESDASHVTFVRPPVPGALPADRGWVAVQDTLNGGWRVLEPGNGRVCRRSQRDRCPNEPVAQLNRQRRTDHGIQDAWWSYCAEHMYGRWVEDGRVLVWNVRKEEDS